MKIGQRREDTNKGFQGEREEEKEKESQMDEKNKESYAR